MQSLLNRAHQHRKWRPQKQCVLLLDFPIVTDKQLKTQVKMEDAQKLHKIPKSECPDVWIRLPKHECPKSWEYIEDLVVSLERNFYGHPLAGLLWEGQFEKNIDKMECLFVHRKQKLFLSVYVDDIKIASKKSSI